MNSPEQMKIVVTKDGPYRVVGGVPISRQVIVADAEGASRQWAEGEKFAVSGNYDLCRCGESQNKPFCDSTHFMSAFDGTEKASREPYVDQAGLIEGPSLLLTDAEAFCAYARFCDPDGSVWALVEHSDDPAVRDKVIAMASACPSGRLVAWDKASQQAIEPDLEPSIGVIEDPQEGISGPLWVRGGITIESEDGTPYETRNRVTACRCGASGNKPFCDGTHASIGFKAGP
jgi:CDGSH-type Zn-finger protein